jgi:hypothetical protein
MENKYQFTDKELKDFTDAFNLLNNLTIQGFQNINILGNSIALFQKFFNSIQRIDESTEQKKGE